ncbi:MAG: metal-sensitive transcriptional regulator [Candidatus Methylomirabilales bacterium]
MNKKEEGLKRLKTIEGHIRGVVRMVEEEAYCIDILHQTLAIQRAIDRFNQGLLESHLQTCVITAMRDQSDQRGEQVIRELMDVFAASTKR